MRKIFYILAALVLVACRTAVPQQKETANASFAARQALTYEQQRQFDMLYLESVNQRNQLHFDAEYELLDQALKINPKASEALFDMGQLLVASAPFGDSLQVAKGDSLLKLAVELEPSNGYMRRIVAGRCIENEDYKTAAKLFEQILAENPNEENLELLVRLYFLNKDWSQALAGLERYENQYGKDESTVYNKFQLFCEMGREKEAFAMVEQYCAENPTDLAFRSFAGDLYLQKNRKDEGLKIYKEVLDKDSTNFYAQTSLMLYHQKNGNEAEYRRLLESCVLNPRTTNEARTQILFEVGTQSVKNQKADSTVVLDLFRKTFENKLGSSDVADLYATYLIECQCHVDSLEKPMKLILEAVPDFEQARFQLMRIYILRSDFIHAKTICQEGQVYQPQFLPYYYYEGVCLSLAGDKKGEADAYRRGVAHIDENSEKTDAADLYSAYAGVLYDAGKTKAAFQMYEKAVENNPEDLTLLNNYAYFLSEQNQSLDKAEEMSKVTVTAEPENPVFLDTYAWILYKRKQYRQAKIYIDAAMKYLKKPDRTYTDHKRAIYQKCK